MHAPPKHNYNKGYGSLPIAFYMSHTQIWLQNCSKTCFESNIFTWLCRMPIEHFEAHENEAKRHLQNVADTPGFAYDSDSMSVTHPNGRQMKLDRASSAVFTFNFCDS
ncbi:hypothetical protein L596_025482 [Steinernema carpocapsae]|uniref:Uncharacterized protein n=1 Tax=Steinernema carpocapsae TaxID=34508 RepID=A0A4U5M7X3_STECR|nr:hypothetical protein L596_025482 [Steinernema carpocapsae]